MKKTEPGQPQAPAPAPDAEQALPDGASPIEDYAIIGNCLTAALVNRNGAIDWLCWPHFDSDACFAALLGDSRNGRWLLAPQDTQARVTRRYQGDTQVLETLFETDEGSVAIIDFMPADPAQHAIIRRLEGRGGRVAMRMVLVLRFEYGLVTPWVTQLEGGGGLQAVAGINRVVLCAPVELRGENRSTVAEFEIAEGQVMDFTLAWNPSHIPPPEAPDVEAALRKTCAFWTDWSGRCEYKGRWRDPVLRAMLTLKTLTFTPTGATVAAPTTSLPEQLGGERNWDYRFCWLRDATLTLLALMAGGYDEEAEAWSQWLHRAAAGAPEELQIMYGIGGQRRLSEWTVDWLPGYQGSAPVRVGNAAATQLQLDTFGEVMRSLSVARRLGHHDPHAAWALQTALVEHLEQIWEEPDDGIWEVRGGRRQFTHSKIMAWVALDSTIRDAETFGLDGPLDRWRALRDHMHAVICEKGFDASRNAFTQSFGSTAMDASLLLIPVVGFLPADDPRMLGTVKAIEHDLLVDGFVKRYHTEGGPDGLPPGEGAFLPCSFWLVMAYAQQGRMQDAEALFEHLLSVANDVGLMSEEYDIGAQRLVGNFPQAYTHLSLIGAALTLDGHDLSQLARRAPARDQAASHPTRIRRPARATNTTNDIFTSYDTHIRK
jgi:GH15 family glucan-1,4-alpha-glucosidase